MNPTARLRRIAEERERLLGRVEAMAEDLLTVRPRPDKWSIREIVEHLVLAEQSVLGDPRELEGLEPRDRTVRHRILYLIVMFVLRFDIPVEAPARDMLPTGEAPVGELGRRWRENHRRLGAYLDALEPGGRRPAIFHHPVCGPMTPAQALRMLEVHLHRHIRQIDAIERSRGSGDGL